METMSERIKRLRKSLDLTLEQVGDAVGVNKATVLRWENGEIEHTRASNIVKLAPVLRTTPEYIVFGKESGQPEPISESERELLASYKRAKASNNPAVVALLEALDKVLKLDEQGSGDMRLPPDTI